VRITSFWSGRQAIPMLGANSFLDTLIPQSDGIPPAPHTLTVPAGKFK